MTEVIRKIFVPLCIIGVAGILSWYEIGCDDHWWHVAAGRVILEQKVVPSTDPFTFTYAGQPWRNNEWGFSVIAAILWDSCGEIGFFLYRWVTFAGTLLFVYLALAERLRRVYVVERVPVGFGAIVILLLSLVLQIRINIRPHMIEYLFLSFTLWILHRSQRLSFSFFMGALPFLAMWAFLHPSWIAAPFVGISFVLDRRIEDRGGWLVILRHVRPSFLTGGVLASALLVVVLGSIFLRDQVSFYWDHFFEMGTIFEWRSYLSWFTLHPFFAVTLLYYLVTLVSLPTLWGKEPFMTFTIAVTLILSLIALRFSAEFLIVSLPFVAGRIYSFLGQRYRDAAGGWTWNVRILAMLGILTMMVALTGNTFLINRSWGIGVSTVNNPVLVADFMERHHISGNLWADQLSYHSYISFRLWPAVKVFIDGRNTQVFPVSFTQGYAQGTVNLSHYPVELLLVSKGLSFVKHFSEDVFGRSEAPFMLVYFNEHWALYMSRDALDRHPHVKPFRLLYPGNLVDAQYMRRIVKEGKMPELKEELHHYGTLAVASEEKRLYALMGAEIAQYETKAVD